MPAAQDLTARIRALYETTSVPVREIAAIAGVTERTLYKYVARHHWKRRYVCLPRDDAVRRANRGRRWQADARCAPAKGSGGRFIRREDIGKPFPSGLKALDAHGRARALAACDAVDPRAQEAQRAAERDAAQAEVMKALTAAGRAARKLADYREACARKRACDRQRGLTGTDSFFYRRLPKPPKDFVESPDIERALQLSVQAAVDYLDAAQRERDEGLARAP